MLDKRAVTGVGRGKDTILSLISASGTSGDVVGDVVGKYVGVRAGELVVGSCRRYPAVQAIGAARFEEGKPKRGDAKEYVMRSASTRNRLRGSTYLQLCTRPQKRR